MGQISWPLNSLKYPLKSSYTTLGPIGGSNIWVCDKSRGLDPSFSERHSGKLRQQRWGALLCTLIFRKTRTCRLCRNKTNHKIHQSQRYGWTLGMYFLRELFSTNTDKNQARRIPKGESEEEKKFCWIFLRFYD